MEKRRSEDGKYKQIFYRRLKFHARKPTFAIRRLRLVQRPKIKIFKVIKMRYDWTSLLFESSFSIGMIGIGIALIIPLLYTHSHFKDRVQKNFDNKKREYSENMAKITVSAFKNLYEKYPYQPTPPFNELEKMYADLYEKQWLGLDQISSAIRLENYLSNTMFLFFLSIASFLSAGALPNIIIFNQALQDLSPPFLIAGILSVAIACYRVYQIGKKV